MCRWAPSPGLHIARGYLIGATTRWSAEDRMGVVFATPLQIDEQGRIALPPPAARPTPPEEADGLRRTA